MIEGAPHLLIFAGPNGAGKTTYALRCLATLPRHHEFLNADHFAKELRAQGAPDGRVDLLAAQMLVRRTDEAVIQRIDFALETTLSGQSYLQSIPQWRQAGYFVEMHYLRLANVEASIESVKTRVATGGHDIPETTLRRRFPLSLRNLAIAKTLVDLWYVFERGHDHPSEAGRNA